MKTPSKTYSIAIPVIETGTENFAFNAKVSEGLFVFNLKWNKFKSAWTCYVTLPDLTVRQAGVWPNVTSWSCCLDYGLRFETTLAAIGINDISNINLFLLVW